MHDVVLTRQGMVELSSRAQRLDEEILPALRENLWSADRDGRDDVALELALGERVRMLSALRRARISEDLPDDPDVVEVGDWVLLRGEDGGAEVFRIVHPVEAPLDDVRIGSDSPLGTLLLGRRVGDEVELRTRMAPPIRYTILGCSRTDPPDVAA